MPPPTSSQMCSPAISNVRITTLSSSPAAGEANPIAPVNTSRALDSSSSITPTAAIFGAPVTEPGGKLARSRSASSVPGRRSAATSETRCQTPGCASTPAQLRHVDGSEARDAAEVVADEVDDHHVLGAVLGAVRELGPSASAVAATRRRVPLIGRLLTTSPRRSRNSSGDRLATAPQSPSR